MFKRILSIASLSITALLFSGCTNYEYDLVRPTELATHISKKAESSFERDPFEYRMRAVEDRLVINIKNKTDDPIQLLGDRSSVVDPGGQSHPLRSQTMAANSFIKLILPPPRPTVRQTGPTFGIGVGTRIGDRRGYNDSIDGFNDPFYDEPRYMVLIDDDAMYWSWRGEGDVRLLLMFQRGDQTFSQEFVIRRVKM